MTSFNLCTFSSSSLVRTDATHAASAWSATEIVTKLLSQIFKVHLNVIAIARLISLTITSRNARIRDFSLRGLYPRRELPSWKSWLKWQTNDARRKIRRTSNSWISSLEHICRTELSSYISTRRVPLCLPRRGWNKSRCLDNAGLNSYKGNCLPHSLAGTLSSLSPDYLRSGLHRIEKERRDFTSSVEKITLERASWPGLSVT